MKTSLNSLSAVQLRSILLASLGAVILLGAIGFYFIQSQLSSFAVEVSHAAEDAKTSDNDITALKRLQTQLADNESNVERARSIVADSKSYKYQDQIIQDLNTYAARSKFEITRFTFNGSAPGASGTSAAAAAKTPELAPGLKSTTVSITLKSPTPYKDLMNFIHAIEQNLTKMQIAGVTFAKGEKSSDVAISSLTIEVYTQ